MDAKTKAIVAHITPIGWVIAFILNSNDKEAYSSFFIRQTLGIYVFGFLFKLIPVIGWIMSLVVFAFWVVSLIYAAQGDRKLIPFGEYFQDWFRTM